MALDEGSSGAYNITYRKDGVLYMATATITSKGQTTIPKEVRAAANLKPGDRIHFAVLEDGTIIVRVKNRSIRDIAFKPPGGKRVSIAQMNR
ncbi:MAG TPA: type II toxin-antitoxin system PrlF family antitoxin [Steroidobacteraceae bacterium]|jgi:AbrB family looped-hinge helix DNA binding protein